MRRFACSLSAGSGERALWRRHPALAESWSSYVERYLDYDLVGEPPKLRPRTRKDAVLGDTRSQLVEDLVPRSLIAMHGPVRFLRAPRGIMNDAPLYAEDRLATWAAKIDRFSWTTIPDVNHYTILLSQRGAKAVAEEVRALIAQVGAAPGSLSE